MGKRIKVKALLESTQTNIEVTVKGWVRTFRNNQFIALNDGSTNSNIQIVVDFENADPALLKRITTGAALSVTGTLVESLGKGQKFDIKATDIQVLGDSDPEKYPLQPKKHSLEFLREIAHLRFRTNTFGAIFRVRNSLAYAVHKFFQERGFVYLHTPVITQSDAEGAGESFKVTNFDLQKLPLKNLSFLAACKEYYERLNFYYSANFNGHKTKIDNILKSIISSKLEDVFGKNSITFKDLICAEDFQIEVLLQLKNLFKPLNTPIKNFYDDIRRRGFFVGSEKNIVKVGDLKKLVETEPDKSASEISEILLDRKIAYIPLWLQKKISHEELKIPLTRINPIEQAQFLTLSFFNIKYIVEKLKVSKDTFVDYTRDFFGKATNLTVSGQLEGELGAMALSDIYTFGPTFRAENSNTTRHLAEFWMIEPEMAFYDLVDNMDLAEALLKYVIGYAIEHNLEDLEFLSQRLADEEKQKPQNERSEMGLLEKLQFCLDNDFQRLTYTEAIDILKDSTPNKKKKFQYLIEGWGADLQSEHERYLVEKHFKKPVILTDYPKEIKAFYMRQNDDGKTVRAMDILFPGIGEIVGGSQREERLDKLEQRMNEMGIPTEELWWYLDTRRFGACPHAGFGLGFERLVLFVTGMGNIRDVIPFPRFPKNAEF